jgi:hypothetical protein
MKHIHCSGIWPVPLGFVVWGFLPGTQLIRPLNATDWRQNMTVVMFSASYVIMKMILRTEKLQARNPEVSRHAATVRLPIGKQSECAANICFSLLLAYMKQRTNSLYS